MALKKKLYKRSNAYIYWADGAWWYCPVGNFLTAWQNMRHTRNTMAVLNRAEGQRKLTEAEAEREVRG